MWLKQAGVAEWQTHYLEGVASEMLVWVQVPSSAPYLIYNLMSHAGVAKLAYALDLGSSAERHVGSSPFTCTSKRPASMTRVFWAAE